jgi:hypothetical protein
MSLEDVLSDMTAIVVLEISAAGINFYVWRSRN